jgi:hypothetical protein
VFNTPSAARRAYEWYGALAAAQGALTEFSRVAKGRAKKGIDFGFCLPSSRAPNMGERSIRELQRGDRMLQGRPSPPGSKSDYAGQRIYLEQSLANPPPVSVAAGSLVAVC